jgi:class 3 adenylate cyclase
MAYFTGVEHEYRAVLATAALVESFRALREFWEPDMDSTLWRFPTTVGVASGELCFLYRNDPFGLAVDLAARLQGYAESGTAAILSGTVEDAIRSGKLDEIKPFFKTPEIVTVKSFGDVSITKLVMPSMFDVPHDQTKT